MKKTAPMVIFQNYFSPYRHKLFVEIGKHLPLTVVYMQKPDEEGRKWDEENFGKNKNYDTLQLENTRPFPVGPLKRVVWVKGLNSLMKILTPKTKVVLLDNLPTNFTMLRVIRKIRNIVPRQNRILWEEHILPKGGDSDLKTLYKKTMTFLLSLRADTAISFSAMTTEYLKKLGIPMTGQKVVRTIQATYTKTEVAEFQKEAAKIRKEKQSLTFGFLGYMSKRKGIHELLNAIRYYKNPKAKFLFVGTGPLRGLIEKMALLDTRIIVKPYAETEADKTNYFAQMSVNVVPSEKDPWCVVVTEAACRGVISLVSPYVGAKELVSLIDKSFVMSSNNGMAIAKAFTEIEKRFSNREEEAAVRAKTLEVSANWGIEQAAEVFIKLA